MISGGGERNIDRKRKENRDIDGESQIMGLGFREIK